MANETRSLICLSKAALFLLMLAVSTDAQLLPYPRDVNVVGWKVPAIRGSHLISTADLLLEGKAILKREFRADKNLPHALVDRNKRYYCEFAYFTTYSIKEKIFAIDGDCVMISFTPVTSSKGERFVVKDYFSGMTRYIFYDENGDGKFESRYNSSPRRSIFQDCRSSLVTELALRLQLAVFDAVSKIDSNSDHHPDYQPHPRIKRQPVHQIEACQC